MIDCNYFRIVHAIPTAQMVAMIVQIQYVCVAEIHRLKITRIYNKFNEQYGQCWVADPGQRVGDAARSDLRKVHYALLNITNTNETTT